AARTTVGLTASAGNGADVEAGHGAGTGPVDARTPAGPAASARGGAGGITFPGGLPTAGPLPPVTAHGPRTAGPLPSVADPGRGTAVPLPALPGPADPAAPFPPNPWAGPAGTPATEAGFALPGPWTKVAETPPPGMSLGARGGATPADDTVPGAGDTDASPPLGEFGGQVAPSPPAGRPGSGAEPVPALTAVSRTPAESGGPCVSSHTDGDERDDADEETSPSDFRAMTAR
ncbi:hypothetical protein ACFW6B_28785, partial [Streptomyces sp. NPDC058751]